MSSITPDFLRIDTSSPQHIYVQGQWTLAHYKALQAALKTRSYAREDQAQLDFTGLDAIDTSGAQLLCDWLGYERAVHILQQAVGLSPERQRLLDTVAQTGQQGSVPNDPSTRPTGILVLLSHIGTATVRFFANVRELLGFIGLTLETWFFNFLRPAQWRVTSIVAQLEETGLNAVPIIALLTFMVGAVVAFLGATILSDFGATVYTVDLVAFSFLREFAVLLTAILMAGRTASAFTAQIGSMKINEEIDALRALGLDPILLLVVPRVIALLIALPLLTFIGMVAGIFGGMMVCALTLGISPTMFMSVFKADVSLTQFLLGMSKAPIFAFLIATIGCMQGFKVVGSAQSVGERTTMAVVHSIFTVILIDAIAALFFMEMGW